MDPTSNQWLARCSLLISYQGSYCAPSPWCTMCAPTPRPPIRDLKRYGHAKRGPCYISPPPLPLTSLDVELYSGVAVAFGDTTRNGMDRVGSVLRQYHNATTKWDVTRALLNECHREKRKLPAALAPASRLVVGCVRRA